MSTTKDFQKKIVLTQAQYDSRKSAGTLQEGVEYCISDYQEPVQNVQINGTSILSSGIANIPVGSSSALGVVGAVSSQGTAIGGDGKIYTVAADATEIASKSQGYKPIVPAQLDAAIMEGLGSNSLTWSDAYKSNARNTIGAITMKEYTGSETSYAENTLYYVVEN